MPPKAEYWSISNQQFKQLKDEINALGERLLENLQQYGFTKIKSSNDWLGVTVEKHNNNLLTFVCFSLNRETPLEFEITLRQWDVTDPSKTKVDFYNKTFTEIGEFSVNFDTEFDAIKTKLQQSKI